MKRMVLVFLLCACLSAHPASAVTLDVQLPISAPGVVLSATLAGGAAGTYRILVQCPGPNSHLRIVQERRLSDADPWVMWDATGFDGDFIKNTVIPATFGTSGYVPSESANTQVRVRVDDIDGGTWVILAVDITG